MALFSPCSSLPLRLVQPPPFPSLSLALSCFSCFFPHISFSVVPWPPCHSSGFPPFSLGLICYNPFLRKADAPYHLFHWPTNFPSLPPPSCSIHHALPHSCHEPARESHIPARASHVPMRVLQASARLSAATSLTLPRPSFKLLLCGNYSCFFFHVFFFSLYFAALFVFRYLFVVWVTVS